MLVQSIQTILLLLSAVSCRSIDVHIETGEDGISLGNGYSPAASCYWDGTSPFCAGGCTGGYSDCATSSCGDGACCVTGYKKYCCRGGCSNLQAIHELKANPPKVHVQPKKEPEPEKSDMSDKLAPSKCYWSGTSPFCAGSCDSGYSDCGTSSCGDGACCVTGYKKYCCRGGCSNSIPEPPTLESPSKDTIHLTDGDNDDLCKDTEFICCPPAASRNRECKCIKKDKSPKEIFRSTRQKVLDDDAPGGQLCKDKQTLCCNPGADSNEECACIDE